MTDGWGGAQWVLATLMLLNLVAPLIVYAAGYNRRRGGEFAGWMLSKAGNTLFLFGILQWGGFWK